MNYWAWKGQLWILTLLRRWYQIWQSPFLTNIVPHFCRSISYNGIYVQLTMFYQLGNIDIFVENLKVQSKSLIFQKHLNMGTEQWSGHAVKINKWYPYVKNIRANFPTIKKKCWIIPFSSKTISGLDSLFVPFLYYYFFLWNCQSLENIWMEFLLRPPMKIIQGWKFVNKDTFTLYKFLLTKASPHSNLILLNKQLTLLYFIL